MIDKQSFDGAHERFVCIMVAPNGARRTKADHPALPITPPELAETAIDCFDAGAAAIHLHVRDDHERHSLDVLRCSNAVEAVATAVPDMLVQVTTEAAGICTVDDQERLLVGLRPAFASISIAEIMRDGVERGLAILRQAQSAGTRIQYILYSPDDVCLLARLRTDIIDDDREPSTLLVAGRYGVVDHATVDLVYHLHGALHAEGLTGERKWMVCAFGQGEMACLEAAISLGGHVRVGFENAIVDASGALASSNAERVGKIAAYTTSVGRIPMVCGDAAQILG